MVLGATSVVTNAAAADLIATTVDLEPRGRVLERESLPCAAASNGARPPSERKPTFR